jgi:hypothetical protein
MKYYLIIGYTTFDRYEKFAQLQVFIDDVLIEQFDADNVQHKQYSKTLPLGMKFADTFNTPDLNYSWHLNDPNLDLDVEIKFDCPQKFKVIQIDSQQLKTCSKLQIKIIGGPSNYTNGFINKYNLVQIFPLFLVPEILVTNQSLNDNFFKRTRKYYHLFKRTRDTQDYKKTSLALFPHCLISQNDLKIIFSGSKDEDYQNALKKYSDSIQWPGTNLMRYITKDNEYIDMIGRRIGGNYQIEQFIHKKHGIHFLHNNKKPPKGWAWFSLIWYALKDKLKL